MSIGPNTQNARILRALADGRWTTVSEIHRRAGTSRLNSRISELRLHGYEIEHTVGPGATSALKHRYRLLNPPSKTELARLVDPIFDETLPRKEIPRNETHRFRLYKLVYDELYLLATATTPEDVGMAIVTLGSEGEFSGGCLGLLDTHGADEVPGTWIVLPWDTNP